jgi:hypothetical protein
MAEDIERRGPELQVARVQGHIGHMAGRVSPCVLTRAPKCRQIADLVLNYGGCQEVGLPAHATALLELSLWLLATVQMDGLACGRG